MGSGGGGEGETVAAVRRWPEKAATGWWGVSGDFRSGKLAFSRLVSRIIRSASRLCKFKKWMCKYTKLAIILCGGITYTKALGAAFLEQIAIFAVLAILAKYTKAVGDALIDG
jgi:hypothetical protein